MPPRRTLFSIAIGLLLAACVSEKPVTLTAAEVRTALVGMTNYGTAKDGQPFVSYIVPDGSIMIRGTGYADTGRYRILDDGRFCAQYRTIRNGAELCQPVVRVGPRL